MGEVIDFPGPGDEQLRAEIRLSEGLLDLADAASDAGLDDLAAGMRDLSLLVVLGAVRQELPHWRRLATRLRGALEGEGSR